MRIERTWRRGAFYSPKTKASRRTVELPDELMDELRRELILALQIHPKLGTGAKRRAQLFRRFGSDRLLARNDLVDETYRPSDDLGKLGLGLIARLKLLLEELAGRKYFCRVIHSRLDLISGNRQ